MRAGYHNNEKIRFWTHESFNRYVNSAEGLTKKESAASVTFLEDENGVTHTREVIKSLRKELKTVFRDLAIKGLAPKSWGKASASAKNIVRDHMERNWPLLRLAENGWKLEHLASLDYPGWMRTNLNENGKLMFKDEDSESGPIRKRKAGVSKSEQIDKKLKCTSSCLVAPNCNIFVLLMLVADGSDTPSNAEGLGNEAEGLYRISPEPPELVAFPPALPSPPSSIPSFQSTPETLEIPVETPLLPAPLSPPSAPIPSGGSELEIMSPEPSQEPAKETSESPLTLSESLKPVCTQAEVEESASTAASDPAAVDSNRVAVNPL